MKSAAIGYSRAVQREPVLRFETRPLQRCHCLFIRVFVSASLYLDFERGDATSPPSDNILFDNMCYATTPSSSNGNSDLDCGAPPPPSSSVPGGRASRNGAATSPTSRLLLEYEMHLRNTLAKGMDAESCSLHTFEALLSQSMEDLGWIFVTRDAI